MAQLPLDQAITRFQANDERLDKFANGGVTESYTSSVGIPVPSIQKFLAAKDTTINVSAEGILAQSTAKATAANNSAIAAAASAASAAGAVNVFKAQVAASSGASLVGYMPAGGGAVGTDVQSKLRYSVSVQDFGALGNASNDDYAAFQAAINALPANGGRIIVPSLAYVIGTQPTWGAKSIMWDIGPGASFSGAGTGEGKFPYMNTNGAQMAVGPFIQSRSMQHSTNTNGGIAAFNVEMLQLEGYGQGQSVGLFSGMRASSSHPGSNGWVQNMVLAVDANCTGVYQACEIDVDVWSSTADVKGLSLTGAGSSDPDVAIEITRMTGNWNRGIHILRAQDAFVIEPVLGGRGIVMGLPVTLANTAITTKQFANGAETIFMQRNTDTASSGYFIRAVNAANSASVFSVDVAGNLNSNIANMPNLRVSTGALAVSTGTVAFGSSTAVSATAGTNGAAPAQVAAYLEIYSGSVKYKLPMYNA